jgi:uncharacterized membrane protein (UPF0127 family)
MKRLPRLSLLAALAWTASACANGTSPSGAAGEKPGAGATSASAAKAPAAPDSPAQPKKLGTAQPKLPVGTVLLETPPRAPISLKVEVASSDAQRQMGLMFRESMGEDEGMLFLFPTERHNSFWMHNTLIPLDMFFVDADWNVVGIVEQATPQTDDPRNVPLMSQYVLEVNGGFAKRHGISASTPNTQLRFTPPPENKP